MNIKKSLATFSSLSALALALSACGGSQDAAPEPQPQVTTVIIQQVAPSESASSTAAETSAAPAQTPAESAETTAAPAPTSAAPSPSPEDSGDRVVQAITPVDAVAGTSCGFSTTGASRLIVAEAADGISCAEVQKTFADFNATFTSGDTSNYQIGDYTCHTRDPHSLARDGRSVTCTKDGVRLEAMTNYPLGGIPIADSSEFYAQGAEGKSDIYLSFYVGNNVACNIFSNEGGVRCYTFTGSVSDPNMYSLVRMKGSESAELSEAAPKDHAIYHAGTLPDGHSINAYGSSCLRIGDTVECTTDGSKAFTLSLDTFSQR